MSADGLPEGRIVPIDGVALRVGDGPHPWYAGNRHAVDAAWESERSRRPFLFNGTVMMHRGLVLEDGIVAGTSHPTPYANLLYWLREGDRSADIWHLFATPVLVAADGALVLTRMSQKTANPGRIYSPSGSLDLDDIVDGTCDLRLNMAREVMEEAGLDLGRAEADPGALLYQERHVASAFHVYRFDEPAAEIAGEIDAFIASQAEPEVVACVIMRSAADITDDVPAYMAAMIRHHFDQT